MNLFLHETEADATGTGDRQTESELPHTTPDEPPVLVERHPEYADVATLVLISQSETAHRNRLANLLTLFAIPAFACAALAASLNSESGWLSAILAGTLTVPTLWWQANRIHDQQIALLNTHLDRLWIGPLCEALYSADGRVRRVAALILEQLLPQLTDADLGLLTEEQLTCLFRCLTIPTAARDPDLVVAILNALPAIGGESGLLLVERLAAYPRWLPNARRIRDAARAAQTELEQRVMPAATSVNVNTAKSGMETQGLTESERRAQAEMAAYVDGQIQQFEAAREQLQTPGMRFGYLIASYLIIVPYLALMACQAYSAGQWVLAVFCGFGSLLGTQLYRLTMLPKHHAIAAGLAELDDVRCIGRLAEMLEWPDEEVREVAITALTRLLPRVKASDKVFSAQNQRENLRRFITASNARTHSEFVISVMKALEQVGVAEDLPAVQHLASTQQVWGVTIPYSRAEAARLLSVRAAARECVPYLEKIAALGQSSQTLLRASCATSASNDMLVRAADGSSASDPEQLLRAQIDRGNQTDSTADSATLCSR